MTTRDYRTAAPRFAAVALVLALASCGSPRPRLVSQLDAGRKQITFSILEDYDKGNDLTDVAKDFTLFRDLGVTTWRGSISWLQYEPARGAYDFEWLERFADLAASYGITLRPYIDYTPGWAAAGGADADQWNDPPRSLDDWSRFVTALASTMRRHTNVASFEIYNEENARQWWDGTPAAYAAVLARASAAIRRSDPAAQVLLGGMVYPDVSWLQHVCGEGHAGPRLDILPFHAYPETWENDELERYLGPDFAGGFVRTADALCQPKPIWINETGFATVEGRTERDQAAWWARAVATFTAAPRVEHIGIYEIKDLRPDRAAIGGAPNYHLGITTADRRKKLAFATLQRLVALLQGVPLTLADAQVAPAAPAGADVYHHVFVRPDGAQVVFVWTRGAAATVSVDLPRPGASALEYALDGSAAAVSAFDGHGFPRLALRPDEPRIFLVTP